MVVRGTTDFEIPDRKWLTDNGWVSGNDDGSPLFVKSIQLYVPTKSTGQKFSYSVRTSFKVGR